MPIVETALLVGGGSIRTNSPAVSGAAGARIDANDAALAAAINAMLVSGGKLKSDIFPVILDLQAYSASWTFTELSVTTLHIDLLTGGAVEGGLTWRENADASDEQASLGVLNGHFLISTVGCLYLVGKGLILSNLEEAPATPTAGQIYYNSTDNRFYGWNGSEWRRLDVGVEDATVWVDSVALDGNEALVTFSGPVAAGSFMFDANTTSAGWQSGNTQTQESANVVRCANGGSGFGSIASGNEWRISSSGGVVKSPQRGVIS